MGIIKVGDKLYNTSLLEYEVTAVGRKWIRAKLRIGREIRVDKATLRTEKDYLGNSTQLYASRVQVEAIRFEASIRGFVKDYFSGIEATSKVNRISMDDLQTIAKILHKYK